MTTVEAPPRKPRGARRWPWVVCVVLASCGYLCTYAILRAGGRFVLSSSIDDSTIVGERIAGPGTATGTNGVTIRDITFHQSPTLSTFRPCIAVEEWWLNR